jgi:hypothetical protein
MKTPSKIAVVILALFAATAAFATNGVVVECPASVVFGPQNVPAGWHAEMVASQPFVAGGVRANGDISCSYAYPNPKNAIIGSVTQAGPKGMTCKVNPSSPRQFDCLPKK